MSGWPYPQDRAVHRARQVAQQYRAALERVDPPACHAIDQAACWAGETWIVPQVAQYDGDDRVPVSVAAELTGMSVRWVYAWVAADRSRNLGDDRILVRVEDVRSAAARC